MNWYKLSFRYTKEQLEQQGYKFRVENKLPWHLSILAYENETWVGEATFSQDKQKVLGDCPDQGWAKVWDEEQDALKPHQMWVTNLWVDYRHRRKGIASALYEIAEQSTGNKIIRTPSRTPDSDVLWKQKNKNFGEVA